MLEYGLEIAFKATSSLYMDKKPIKGEYLEVLLRSSKTVFSTKDVVLMWGEEQNELVTRRLSKYVKAGKLLRIRRGFYAKDSNYNRFELATRIYTPSYISFETVLTREGVNFQYYGNIFVASYINREINIGNQKITYVRMKDYVLSNVKGLEHSDDITIATKERAFLDRIYVTKEYHFDNLGSMNWDKVFEMIPIYHNKRLDKKVRFYYMNAKENNKSV